MAGGSHHLLRNPGFALQTAHPVTRRQGDGREGPHTWYKRLPWLDLSVGVWAISSAPAPALSVPAGIRKDAGQGSMQGDARRCCSETWGGHHLAGIVCQAGVQTIHAIPRLPPLATAED